MPVRHWGQKPLAESCLSSLHLTNREVYCRSGYAGLTLSWAWVVITVKRGGNLFWETDYCHSDESDGALWTGWVTGVFFYLFFYYVLFFKCKQNVTQGGRTLQNDQINLSVEGYRMELFGCLFRHGDNVCLWTRVGSMNQWFAHCGDDSESEDDCSATQ